MYIEAGVAPDCRSARNNLYSEIALLRQVRSLISLPCSVSLCFWSFLASLFPCFLVSLFPCFLVSLFPRFLVSSFPCFLVSLFPCFLVFSFPRFLVSSFPRFLVSRFGFRFISRSVSHSDSVLFPVPFHVSDSVPRSSILDQLPFWFPFRTPFPFELSRGSPSRYFWLCSSAELLYIKGSA